jgi:hypothetical protein
MDDAMKWIEMVGRLIPDLAKLAIELFKSGDPDPETTLRREILDRRMAIASNRELRDRQLELKHGRGGGEP